MSASVTIGRTLGQKSSGKAECVLRQSVGAVQSWVAMLSQKNQCDMKEAAARLEFVVAVSDLCDTLARSTLAIDGPATQGALSYLLLSSLLGKKSAVVEVHGATLELAWRETSTRLTRTVRTMSLRWSWLDRTKGDSRPSSA